MQLKSEATWKNEFGQLENKNTPKMNFEDFVKLFSFYKTIEGKEKAIKQAMIDGFNINEKNNPSRNRMKIWCARFANRCGTRL